METTQSFSFLEDRLHTRLLSSVISALPGHFADCEPTMRTRATIIDGLVLQRRFEPSVNMRYGMACRYR